jgi:hypothetical protein
MQFTPISVIDTQLSEFSYLFICDMWLVISRTGEMVLLKFLLVLLMGLSYIPCVAALFISVLAFLTDTINVCFA